MKTSVCVCVSVHVGMCLTTLWPQDVVESVKQQLLRRYGNMKGVKKTLSELKKRRFCLFCSLFVSLTFPARAVAHGGADREPPKAQDEGRVDGRAGSGHTGRSGPRFLCRLLSATPAYKNPPLTCLLPAGRHTSVLKPTNTEQNERVT